MTSVKNWQPPQNKPPSKRRFHETKQTETKNHVHKTIKPRFSTLSTISIARPRPVEDSRPPYVTGAHRPHFVVQIEHSRSGAGIKTERAHGNPSVLCQTIRVVVSLRGNRQLRNRRKSISGKEKLVFCASVLCGFRADTDWLSPGGVDGFSPVHVV